MRLLNIIVQEQEPLFLRGDAGFIQKLSARLSFRLVITATPSVALENLSGLRVKDAVLFLWFFFFFNDKPMAYGLTHTLRVEFFFFCSELGGENSLNSQSVYSWGGRGGFKFTPSLCAQKSNIDTQTCHRVDECVSE